MIMTQDTDNDRKWWNPVDPVRHHREGGWDYRGRAIYHFTLPVAERYPLFGTLEGERAETAYVRLNAFGRRVCQMLSRLAQFYKEKGYALKVLAQMVMPDHVHLVIQVLEPLPRSIGTVVRGFKSGCTKVYKEEYCPSGKNAAGVHGDPQTGGNEGCGGGAQTDRSEGQGGGPLTDRSEGQGGGAQTDRSEGHEDVPMHFARIFAGSGSIWQPDKAYYHERILHAPGQLRRMIDYVKDNPRRLWLKSHNPDLFRLHRRTEAAGLSFSSMGNHFLLNWPDAQTVEMSRSATDDQIQERLCSVLAAAHDGAVTYTAAISKGERLIARTLRERGYPLVILLCDGFPKEGTPHERYYKPGGVYFEACSKARLLLLEPTEEAFLDVSIQKAVEATLRRKAEERHYSYSPIPVNSQRYRFTALNEMANLLALQ